MARNIQYVTFYSENELFGVDIRVVNEVNPLSNIMPVPLSDPHIKGLVNIRGQVVLVIDIAVIFGKAARPAGTASHIVIMKTVQDFARVRGIGSEYDTEAFSDKPVGFFADRIGDTVVVSEEMIEKPTQYLDRGYSKYIIGVVNLGDRLMILLDPVKILWFNEDGFQ